jgi:hypothetical protein
MGSSSFIVGKQTAKQNGVPPARSSRRQSCINDPDSAGSVVDWLNNPPSNWSNPEPGAASEPDSFLTLMGNLFGSASVSNSTAQRCGNQISGSLNLKTGQPIGDSNLKELCDLTVGSFGNGTSSFNKKYGFTSGSCNVENISPPKCLASDGSIKNQTVTYGASYSISANPITTPPIPPTPTLDFPDSRNTLLPCTTSSGLTSGSGLPSSTSISASSTSHSNNLSTSVSKAGASRPTPFAANAALLQAYLPKPWVNGLANAVSSQKRAGK